MEDWTFLNYFDFKNLILVGLGVTDFKYDVEKYKFKMENLIWRIGYSCTVALSTLSGRYNEKESTIHSESKHRKEQTLHLHKILQIKQNNYAYMIKKCVL